MKKKTIPQNSRPAFSLIELVCAIAVLLIVAALAVAGYLCWKFILG